MARRISRASAWLVSDRRRIVGFAVLAVVVLVAGFAGYRVNAVRQYTDLYWRNHTNVTEQSDLYSLGKPGLDHFWQVSKDGGSAYEPTYFDANIPYLADGQAGQSMLGLVPYTYGDAEVDGSIFQWGSAGRDGAGLVLRANVQTGDMVVFQLNKQAGAWAFKKRLHGVWITLQGTTSSDLINRTGDWNNLLAAIMRGDQYLLYINYQFVGEYTDATLHGGSVGLFAENGAVSLRSGGFTVYRTA